MKPKKIDECDAASSAAYNPKETSPNDAPDRTRKNRKRTIVCSIAACGVMSALALGGAWFAFGDQPTQEPTAPTASAKKEEPAQVSQKKDEKSEVVVSIVTEGAGSEASKAKVEVLRASGGEAVIESEITANEPVSLGKFTKGEYKLEVTAVPVCSDGSTYVLPEESKSFTVDGEGKEVKVSLELKRLSAEEMTDEQLEASAAALEASGNAEAAQAVKSKAAEAPKTSGSSAGSSTSSESNGSSGSVGTSSGGGSSTPQPPTPEPTPTPAPELEPAPEPQPPAHVHKWVPNVVDKYGDKCATCGEPNPSWEHSKNHLMNGESDRVLNNVVIGKETKGSKCEGCGATK